MHSRLLLDHTLAVTQHGWIVRALLRVEGQVPEGAPRPPLDLSLVLDRSGSMGGERLEAARHAAATLVRRLAPSDVVSVVAFDGEVRVVAPPATGEAQALLPTEIAAIEAGGSTNLSGGWLRALDLVEQSRRPGSTDRIFLLTDGHANAGITDPGVLRQLCAKALERGIRTSTVGFGEGYDEDLLRAMADAGGGNAWYIERPDQAEGVFGEELEGLLTLAAQNVLVEVRLSPHAQLAAVRHDYPSEPIPGGVRLTLGDVYAREPRTVLIELLVPVKPDDPTTALAELEITGHVLTAAGGLERQKVKLPIAIELTPDGASHPEIAHETLLLDAARTRAEAERLATRGDTGAAAVLLCACAERLDRAGGDDEEARGHARDLRRMAQRMDDRDYRQADAKYLKQRAYNTHRGRRNYEKLIDRNPK